MSRLGIRAGRMASRSSGTKTQSAPVEWSRQHAMLRDEIAAAERKYHADLAVREVIPRPDNQRINFFVSTGFWHRGTVA